MIVFVLFCSLQITILSRSVPVFLSLPGLRRSVGPVQPWPESRFKRGPHTEEDSSDDSTVEDHEQ